MNTCVEKSGDGLQIDYHKVARSADPLLASFFFGLQIHRSHRCMKLESKVEKKE